MPRQKTEAASYAQLCLRLPQELLLALRHQAQTIGRPVNTHICWLLREGIANAAQKTGKPATAQGHQGDREHVVTSAQP